MNSIKIPMIQEKERKNKVKPEVETLHFYYQHIHVQHDFE